MAVLPMLAFGQVENLASCGPVPTEDQLRWQNMEMYAFIHYSLNTYTDQEWGFGNEALKLFNPSDLDCRQWQLLIFADSVDKRRQPFGLPSFGFLLFCFQFGRDGLEVGAVGLQCNLRWRLPTAENHHS